MYMHLYMEFKNIFPVDDLQVVESQFHTEFDQMFCEIFPAVCLFHMQYFA